MAGSAWKALELSVSRLTWMKSDAMYCNAKLYITTNVFLQIPEPNRELKQTYVGKSKEKLMVPTDLDDKWNQILLHLSIVLTYFWKKKHWV